MKILLSAAEVAPYAKVGGLADVSASLPKAWKAAGHDVMVVLPRYGNISEEAYDLTRLDLLVTVPFGDWVEYCDVWHGKLIGSDVDVYFVDAPEYYDRPGIYGYHEGYDDNDRRFIFLCRATFEVARALNFQPDVVHAHDYHTALTMPMLHILYAHDPFFANTAGVFTIHNMAYQGMFEPVRALEFAGLGQQEFYEGSWFEHHGVLNAMKAGIMFADKVTTVSPTYAQEIRWTPEGMGLQSALQARAGDVIGVLNGIDTTEWHPSVDTHITVQYDRTTIEKKEINKRALLTEFGLTKQQIDHDLPLVGMVSRFTEQKGISLLSEALEGLISSGSMRLVILGSGEASFEEYLQWLQAAYPDRVLVGRGYNNALSHKIQAASDFYLMPSKFEPCGLTQMYALAYGTIPIVRAVGGLSDTVHEYDPITFTGTGVRFHRYTADDLTQAVHRALRLYKKEPHWTHIRTNAMEQNFGSAASAEHYINVFEWAREKHASHPRV
jgi:starch synthase